jgi:hypothetical protein
LVLPDAADGAIVVWSLAPRQLYAQRLAPNGAPQWTLDGVPVAPGSGEAYQPQAVPDGSGGALVAWLDDRSGALEVYAQRIDARGAPMWPASGVRVASAPAIDSLRLVTLGGGAAVVAWTDIRNVHADVYAQRLSPDGALSWPTDGLPVTAAPGSQTQPALVADGTGGVIVAWADARGGAFDVYAQRLSPTGQGMWIDSGRPVSTAPGDQMEPTLLADGDGGAYVAWMDRRSGSPEVYAAHVHATGVLPIALDRFSVE